uniref:UDP-glucuronic acid decarboxylase 1 n=1 Tax=Zea mays TaxID=4577 RepID=A0A804N2W4_MAIZE
MASELTYRGGSVAPGSASNGGEYSPKSSKPLSWLARAARYAAAEHRPVFALAGMLFAAAIFTFSSPSTLSPSEPAASVGFNHLAVSGHPSFRESVGGKVPLGLRRRALRVLVTGGAGFVGSHLVDRLLERGDSVIVVDNFFTGRKGNVAHHLQNPRFEVIRHDVVEPILLEVDQIYHLACPASPVHYKYNPIKTIKTNVVGTLNMLGLAKRIGARFLLTSTSEVYGDPLQHPQVETYWGNVNPIGVRSCYDEGKRTAETLTMDYHRGANLEVRIARIFNTYGPRMCIDDGRVVSNFVAQALRKEPLTVYGDGKQTRSFQYVSDLVSHSITTKGAFAQTCQYQIPRHIQFASYECIFMIHQRSVCQSFLAKTCSYSEIMLRDEYQSRLCSTTRFFWFYWCHLFFRRWKG